MECARKKDPAPGSFPADFCCRPETKKKKHDSFPPLGLQVTAAGRCPGRHPVTATAPSYPPVTHLHAHTHIQSRSPSHTCPCAHDHTRPHMRSHYRTLLTLRSPSGRLTHTHPRAFSRACTHTCTHTCCSQLLAVLAVVAVRDPFSHSHRCHSGERRDKHRRRSPRAGGSPVRASLPQHPGLPVGHPPPAASPTPWTTLDPQTLNFCSWPSSAESGS